MTHLDGTGDGNLVVNTTAFPTRSPANPGFVHLNMVLGLSTDPVLVGPHHARAELVENLKGRLVARKTKLPLKLHGGHAGRPHPEQGFRSCIGILRLAKTYGSERLEAACERALEIDATSYSSVASILKNKLERRAPRQATDGPAIDHPNIRGPQYFH